MANTVWYSIKRYGNDITAHEVVKETPSQIVILVKLFDQTTQRRVNKHSDYESYYSGISEARFALVQRYKRQIESNRRSIAEAEQALATVYEKYGKE